MRRPRLLHFLRATLNIFLHYKDLLNIIGLHFASPPFIVKIPPIGGALLAPVSFLDNINQSIQPLISVRLRLSQL
jgi:hypothetical protein